MIMSLTHLLYLSLFSVASTASREKRFLSNPEKDINQEFVKLQTDFANFKDSVQTELQTAIKVLNDKLKLNNEELKLHKDELLALKDKLQNEHGSVYVRWGRTACPQNGTTLVYKGYMAGKHFDQKGSGTNSVCLPGDPTWGKYQNGSQVDRAYIYGAEYQEPDDVVFGKHINNEDIPCAVCKVPAVSVMIPARADCYPGWRLEYTGYLMANYHAYYGTEYVCLDGDPEFVTRGGADTNGHLMYLVEGRCGALVCPPYFNYRELACVVCSL